MTDKRKVIVTGAASGIGAATLLELVRTGYDVVGLDINELTPAYDRGETALLAARLAREFIAARAKHKIL